VGPAQPPGGLPPQAKGTPLEEAWEAALFEYNFHYSRHLTNFPHHYFRAQAEMQPEMVQARKDLYEAEQLRLAAKSQALPRYEQALQDWRDKVLAKYQELLSDDILMEDLYEAELNYLQFFLDSPQGRQLKQGLFVQGFLGQAGSPAVADQLLSLSEMLRPQAVRAPLLVAPLDGKMSDGQRYWIDPLVRQRVLVRKGLAKAGGPPEGVMMGPGGVPMKPSPGAGGIQPLPPPPMPGAIEGPRQPEKQ
jgi:hypothetical protein